MDSKIRKDLASNSRVGAIQTEVEAKTAGVTNLGLDSGTRPTLQLARSQPSSITMKTNANLLEPSPQVERKLFAKPTGKLMEAVQNREPGSKPLQVKLVRRDSDEDTSEYESACSNGTISAESPCPTAQDLTVKNRPKIDLSSLLEQGKLDMSQIPEKKAVPELDFTGIPAWFPLKIKRLLKDRGFPDAIPFKASTLQLPRGLEYEF
jgi:hypothetical protein